jgi:hypothetical protein
MNKKLIRLTESDLHRIVKESVNRILKETYSDIYGDGKNYSKTMYDNACYFSDTPEEFDEIMKDRQEYLNSRNRLALDNHPQATPFRAYNKNKKDLSGGKSMDAALYGY